MARPPYSICVCPDSRVLKTRLDTLMAAHPPQHQTDHPSNSSQSNCSGSLCAPSSWKRYVFWGDEGLTQNFWEHLTLQGLFATPKALVIRNAQTIPVESLRALSTVILPLTDARSINWPIICFEVPIDKGKPKLPAHITSLPCYEAAVHNKWLDVQDGLTQATIGAFIKAEAAGLGLNLTPQEVTLLAQSLPPDASHINSEMAKLALASGPDGSLPRDTIRTMGQTQEIGIFELLRIIQQNTNAVAAWNHIKEDKVSGENAIFGFTSILLREARILWQCLAGPAPYLPGQIAMQKKIIAEGLGFPGIAKLWDLALQTDKGIKTGERSPDQAFEMLAADLFRLFGKR